MNTRLPALLAETVRSFIKNDCMPMSAGIAYYALFSLFPLLLAIVAVLEIIAGPQDVENRLFQITGQLFPGSGRLVVGNIEAAIEARQTFGGISLLFLLWSASAVFAIIRHSLNRAWNVEKERPFLQRTLKDIGMAVGVGLLFMLSVGTTFMFVFAWQMLPPAIRVLDSTAVWKTASGLTPLCVSFILFLLIYRFGPDAEVRWKDVLPGAVLAAVLFEVAKTLFTWYLTNVAKYGEVYGSLSTVIAFLFWAYLSAIILLLGAELAAGYAKLRRSQVVAQARGDPAVSEEDIAT